MVHFAVISLLRFGLVNLGKHVLDFISYTTQHGLQNPELGLRLKLTKETNPEPEFLASRVFYLLSSKLAIRPWLNWQGWSTRMFTIPNSNPTLYWFCYFSVCLLVDLSIHLSSYYDFNLYSTFVLILTCIVHLYLQIIKESFIRMKYQLIIADNINIYRAVLKVSL